MELRKQKQLQAMTPSCSKVLLPSQFLLIMIYAPFYHNSIYHVVDEKLENIADCSINEVKTIMHPNKSHGSDRIAALHSKKTACEEIIYCYSVILLSLIKI